ncbi:MAG: hypothetical protein LBP26_07350, partial [Clostridiales bacterium]|nr:hypothetical protein [Clostridiales bacterium]
MQICKINVANVQALPQINRIKATGDIKLKNILINYKKYVFKRLRFSKMCCIMRIYGEQPYKCKPL